MDDSVGECRSCGHPALQRTILKYEGMCIPCAKGYRESIEESKRYHADIKKLEQEPSTLFWRDLCSRTCDTSLGFETLTESEKLFFSLNVLIGEVFNGGFEQYFTNSSGDHFEYAVKAVELLGDHKSVEIVSDAKRAIFGSANVPENHATRLGFVEMNSVFENEKTARLLDDLDAAFVKKSDEVLSERLVVFALQNEFWAENSTKPKDE